jgi:hypothetical protein
MPTPPLMMPGTYLPGWLNPFSIWPPIAIAPLRLPSQMRGQNS